MINTITSIFGNILSWLQTLAKGFASLFRFWGQFVDMIHVFLWFLPPEILSIIAVGIVLILCIGIIKVIIEIIP